MCVSVNEWVSFYPSLFQKGLRQSRLSTLFRCFPFAVSLSLSSLNCPNLIPGPILLLFFFLHVLLLDDNHFFLFFIESEYIIQQMLYLNGLNELRV